MVELNLHLIDVGGWKKQYFLSREVGYPNLAGETELVRAAASAMGRFGRTFLCGLCESSANSAIKSFGPPSAQREAAETAEFDTFAEARPRIACVGSCSYGQTAVSVACSDAAFSLRTLRILRELCELCD